MKPIIYITLICFVVFIWTGSGFAENIDPYENGSQYASGENVGWLNFEPNLFVTGLL